MLINFKIFIEKLNFSGYNQLYACWNLIFTWEVFYMKDMIERIIEMDTAARELTQRAQKDKINSEQEIEKK